jgi:hypothetical protein
MKARALGHVTRAAPRQCIRDDRACVSHDQRIPAENSNRVGTARPLGRCRHDPIFPIRHRGRNARSQRLVRGVGAKLHRAGGRAGPGVRRTRHQPRAGLGELSALNWRAGENARRYGRRRLSPLRPCLQQANFDRRQGHQSRYGVHRPPTRNSNNARGTAGAPLPATSCLGAFWTPAAGAPGLSSLPASKTSTGAITVAAWPCRRWFGGYLGITDLSALAKRSCRSYFVTSTTP